MKRDSVIIKRRDRAGRGEGTAQGRGRAPGPGKYDRQKAPEERRAEQRERLLGAAAHVFATKGFGGASVDQIIRRVRMSRRTFYEHFDDLRSALLAVYDAGSKALIQHVERAVRAESDPVAKLHVGIREYLSALGSSAALTRVLYQEIRAAGPAYWARQEVMRSRFVALWMEGVQKAHAVGLARRVPSEETMYALAAAVEMLALRYLERREEDRILEAAPVLMDLAVSLLLHTDEQVQTALDLWPGVARQSA